MFYKMFSLNIFMFICCTAAYGQFTTNLFVKEFNSSALLKPCSAADNNTLTAAPNYNLNSADSSLADTEYNTVRYRSFKIGRQLILSQLSGAVFAFGAAVLGSQILPDLNWGGLYLMYGGYIAGMMLGVHMFGNDKYEQAPFASSLLGGLVGIPIGIFLYNSQKKPRGFNAVAPFVFPSFGAVISFNLSQKPRQR